MDFDKTKTHIFVWVPGTGGHEVHPAFEAQAKKASKEDCTFVCVKYPASADFTDSVEDGVESLKRTLNAINSEKSPHQIVYLAGSSQGSWVMGDTLFNNPLYLDTVVRKAVMFGHPGLAEHHYHFFYDERVWEINNDNDAVTFGWSTKEREEIATALTRMYDFNPRGYLTFMKYAVLHPILMVRLFILIILHTKVTSLVTSPHDYSNQMPLALYWLMH